MKRLLFVLNGDEVSARSDEMVLIESALETYHVIVAVVNDPALIRTRLPETTPIISLKDKGLDIHPFSLPQKDHFSLIETLSAVRSFLAFGKDKKKAKRFLKEISPDLVYVDSTKLIAFAKASNQSGYPVLLRVESSLASGIIGLRRAWLRGTIARCAVRTITRSQHDAAQLRQNHRIRVVPDSVSFNRILSTPALTLPSSLDMPLVVIINTGEFDRKKNDLRRLCDEISFRHPDRHLAIITRSQTGKIENLVHSRNHGTPRMDFSQIDIQITGSLADRNAHDIVLKQRCDLISVLKKSDLLILTSYNPDQSEAILTASALRIPTIARGKGPLTEIVQNGETGILVESDDIDRFLHNVINVLDDAEGRAAMGEAAARRAHLLNDLTLNTRVLLGQIAEIIQSEP